MASHRLVAKNGSNASCERRRAERETLYEGIAAEADWQIEDAQRLTEQNNEVEVRPGRRGDQNKRVLICARYGSERSDFAQLCWRTALIRYNRPALALASRRSDRGVSLRLMLHFSIDLCPYNYD